MLRLSETRMLLVAAALGASGVAFAHDEPLREEAPTEVSPITVKSWQGAARGGIKQDEISKTEIISRERLEHKQAKSLVEAVSNEAGIDAQTSCANCGSRRLTINGLRGEHTTILTDGVPLYSTVSSIYGMDAIPIMGIESIEVTRGAGASLLAPEAIGGVMNVVTLRPRKEGLSYRLLNHGGSASEYLFGAAGMFSTPQSASEAVISGQLANQGFWDSDGNGVAEAPELNGQSILLKAKQELNSFHSIEARYGRQGLGIFGGSTQGFRANSYLAGVLEAPVFEGMNVDRKFLGQQAHITDTIQLERDEGMLRYHALLPAESELQVTSAIANQRQSSVYMHGYDYRNNDWILFNEARYRIPIGDDHFLTFGLEFKHEQMASQSEKLYGIKGLARDDFVYQSRAVYLQEIWTPLDWLEISAAMRGEFLTVNWLEQNRPGQGSNEIERPLVAPRLQIKARHGDFFTSRATYGFGYRAPLTFFESQHGTTENGFVLNITDLETSHALGYSLAFGREWLSAVASVHHTWLSSMAYGEWSTVPNRPLTFRNAVDTYGIFAADLSVKAKVGDVWEVGAGIENYLLPLEYKQKLPVAALERRFQVTSDVHLWGFEWITTLNWVDGRNLADYGYDRHYRDLQEVPIDPDFPELGSQLIVNQQKNLQAPAFATVDVYLGRTFDIRASWIKNLTLFASVENLFDFTQTGFGDSPLNWSVHGNEREHFHLDNNHVWGPLRGRTFLVGLRADL
jgi:outer membrane receptor for ferrienterochelin and colicins